jgi:hypothetical protein
MEKLIQFLSIQYLIGWHFKKEDVIFS